MLRVGVIGLGVGWQHLEAYADHPGCQVVAVADLAADRREAAHARWPGIALHDTGESLIEAGGLDLVSIASYDEAHAGQVIQALTAGLHVFVEKPLCQSRRELDRIARLLAERPGQRLSSNLILRASPRFSDLHARVQTGELGALFFIDADYCYGRLEKLVDGWRGRQAYYSVMLGGGIHLIDLALWLAGDRVTKVQAVANGIAADGGGCRFPDFMAAFLSFESGMNAKISANFGCVRPHFHKLSVYGTAATFENDQACGWLWRSRAPGAEPERLATDYPGVYKGNLAYRFADAVLHRTPPPVAEWEVLDAMAVALAIDQAAITGDTVAVSYPTAMGIAQ